MGPDPGCKNTPEEFGLIKELTLWRFGSFPEVAREWRDWSMESSRFGVSGMTKGVGGALWKAG